MSRGNRDDSEDLLSESFRPVGRSLVMLSRFYQVQALMMNASEPAAAI